MEVRPFRLVGESDRTAVVEASRGPVDGWAQTWFGRVPPLHLAFAAKGEAGLAGEWLAFGELPDRWIAWQPGNAAAKAILQHLFPGSGAGSTTGGLADAVVRDCLADLVERCLAAAGMTTATALTCDAASLPCGEGAGAQFLRLRGDSFDLPLAFGGAVVEALAAPGRPAASVGALQPRLAAIGTGSVRLEVTLGDAELSLADLAGIAVGDVITLDLSPRDPLPVRTAGGQTAFHAYLGRNAERKVIQVSGK